MEGIMKEQLFLLIRVSRPEYNETLYRDYKLYMNPQIGFDKDNMTEGQRDIMEGVITNVPFKLSYSTDEKKSWKLLGDTKLIRKNNSAYIFCMYGLKFDERYYDAKTNKYFYNIPWSYIEPLWQGSNTEMMIIENTSVFITKFHEAAQKRGLYHAYGNVLYDLNEKLSDINYFSFAAGSSFESVYHKKADGYKQQKEVRFSVICPDKPDHYELPLEKYPELRFTLIPLSFGKDIGVELSDLEFDDKLGLPIRFSSKINYYESK